MSDYVWVVGKDISSTFGQKGISDTYIIPNKYIGFSAANLVGSYIWVIFRGEFDRIGLIVKVDEISQILEGYYENDYLIKADLACSFMIGTEFKTLSPFSTDRCRNFGFGINKIDPEDAQLFITIIRTNSVVRLIPPTISALNNLLVEITSSTTEDISKSFIRAIVSACKLADVWSDGKNSKLRTAPFANFSKALIKTKFPGLSEETVTTLLIKLDPIHNLQGRSFDSIEPSEDRPHEMRAPIVDKIFSIIDPHNIFARKFISKNAIVFDPVAAMKKTEAAEKIHQDILRDVSRYLISRGVTPYQSSSIDLMFVIEREIFIVEIKSSNSENAVAQAAKGAFQLASIANSFSDDFDRVTSLLLLENTGFEVINQFIAKTLTTLGVRALFYRKEVEWPSRVLGFPITSTSLPNRSD